MPLADRAAVMRKLDEVDHALNLDGNWPTEERLALAQLRATEAVALALLAIHEQLFNGTTFVVRP